MGSHKHGTKGTAGPSPKTKFMTAFDANQTAAKEQRNQHRPRMWPSLQAAMKHERK